MKYKRLSGKELEGLQEQFIEFLVVNGITADDWVKLKDNDPPAASRMVDSFSDVMYEGWMRNITHLEVVLPKEVLCFYCQPQQIVLVGMSTSAADMDFTQIEDMSEVAQHHETVEIYTKTKPYSKQREIEVFEMMQRGAQAADSTLFNALCLALD
ncbi:MAG: hypothetical protein JJ975_02620 [Bacteroidia bacterium]|nr:hypothetical protein [Bacteroidia bacterium]